MAPATMRKLAYGDPNYFPPESDDCLFINVFAPASKTASTKTKGKSVLLYIHGGGWNLGNGIADLSGFAAYEDVIAVSFNYRTNSKSQTAMGSDHSLNFKCYSFRVRQYSRYPCGRKEHWSARPAAGHAMGADKHRRVWGRSLKSHPIRRLCWLHVHRRSPSRIRRRETCPFPRRDPG